MMNNDFQLRFDELLCDEAKAVEQTPEQTTQHHFPNDLIADFDRFLAYCSENTVSLTKKNEYISRKHLVSLDALLSVKATDVTPNSDQDYYRYIHFLYHLALNGHLLKKETTSSKWMLVGTERIDVYKEFNNAEKFCSILEFFWIDTDWNTLKTMASQRPESQYASVFSTLCMEDPTKKQLLVNLQTKTGDSLHYQMNDWHHFLQYFEWLGLWGCEENVERRKEYYRKGVYFAKSITVTDFGKSIMPFLLFNRNLEAWNIAFRKSNGESEWFPGTPLETLYGFSLTDSELEQLVEYVETDYSDEAFHQAFRSLFPAGELTQGLPRLQKRFTEGAYTFNVTFTSGVWRKLVLPGHFTMHDLHNLIIRSYAFDDDHLYSFFMDGKRWSTNCIASPDDDFGHANAANVRIDSLGFLRGQEFLYLFDYGDEWTFKIKVDDINESNSEAFIPFIALQKGAGPEQYYYEDDESEEDDEDEWE